MERSNDLAEVAQVWICDTCPDGYKCKMRTMIVGASWLYEAQLELCLEEGKPSYEDDDFWMVKEV